eukprot:2991014-Pleurochrysis_carterae.AAC.1
MVSQRCRRRCLHSAAVAGYKALSVSLSPQRRHRCLHNIASAAVCTAPLPLLAQRCQSRCLHGAVTA